MLCEMNSSPSPTHECSEKGLTVLVTGKLAEASLRPVVESIVKRQGLNLQIETLNITVAALLHVKWILQKLTLPEGTSRVVLPGWTQGDLQQLTAHFGVPFERGPKNLYDLPQFFGMEEKSAPDLSTYDIEILAEINHAPRLSLTELLHQAEAYREKGANRIDLGCIPGERWPEVAEVVSRLTREGFALSIDTFDEWETKTAIEHGCGMVLSVNSSNVQWARDLDVSWVVIPDEIRDWHSMTQTIDSMLDAGREIILDPIIEPIGYGFEASLQRYREVRKAYPDLPMMMGIGNITELLEVDSAGVNMLLAAICQELSIHHVLTTEVINWASSSVKEFDLARRMAKYSIEQQTLAKHLTGELVSLRDPYRHPIGEAGLKKLQAQLKDPNFRIFAEQGQLHLLNRDGHWSGDDPYELFDQLLDEGQKLDPTHAFYLGYELCKAMTALTLSKQYTQDESLNWGHLTRKEVSAHERRRAKKRTKPQE